MGQYLQIGMGRGIEFHCALLDGYAGMVLQDYHLVLYNGIFIL
jgi:hypothetical protein